MKNKLFAILLTALLMLPVTSASADYVSTLDFDGFLAYSGRGLLDPKDLFKYYQEEGDILSILELPPVQGAELIDGNYNLVGLLQWDLDLNLPEGSAPYWLELDAYIEGVYGTGQGEGRFGFEDFDLVIDEMWDLGEKNITPNGLKNKVEPIVAEIKNFADGVGLNYELEGNYHEGVLYFGHDDIDHQGELLVQFDGRVTLTAHTGDDRNVIPEPATMMLFGSGLLGFGLRRKRNV